MTSTTPADTAGLPPSLILDETAPRMFHPITLRSVTIPNRLWMAPMCQYSASDSGEDIGAPNEWHRVHLGSRAVGGAGLVMAEATAISPEGRISPHDLGIWNDTQVAAFKPITAFIASQGSIPAIQLAHAGRKASTLGRAAVQPEDGGWTPVGPSAMPFEGLLTPTELSVDEIARVVQDFADAATRAHEAGFQAIEIHGAHGYLVHEFLSPISNTRTDQYGGSFENRIRFALEITEAVRTAWPEELPLLFRVSATDWLEENGDERESWTADQTVQLARELRDRGVDLIDTSSGGNVNAPIPLAPGYQVAYADRIRHEAKVTTGAVGLITTPEQAEDILQHGGADVILIGRELLRNPYFPYAAARHFGFQMPNSPKQYDRR